MMKAEGLEISGLQETEKVKCDKRRLEQSVSREEKGAKKAREIKSKAKLQAEASKVSKEDTSYGAGHF